MDLNQTQAQINQIILQAQQAASAQVAATQAAQANQPAEALQTAQAIQNAGTKSFDATEIAELTSIREAYEQITLTFGQLEMQKREIAKNEKRINERIVAVEAQEKVFLDKIVAKYGEGTFDVNTGIFTPKM